MRTQPGTVASLAGGAITLLVAWPMLAGPFTPQPKPPGRFGMVGLAFGQTARLSAVNLLPPDPVYPPEPCRVTLGFVDAAGHTLVTRDGTEVVKEVSLMPGHAAFLDIHAEQVSRGIVTVGKLADLVLLDANPLEDIRNTRRITAVVLDGRHLDRAALDHLLAAPERPATPRSDSLVEAVVYTTLRPPNVDIYLFDKLAAARRIAFSRQLTTA